VVVHTYNPSSGQEDRKFSASLSYVVRPCQRGRKKRRRRRRRRFTLF
jgi:hypothetical protein